MSPQNQPCFVTTIDLKLADKLRQDLIDQEFELTSPPYTLFSAKKKGLSCTLYQSGKLTVQGKDKDQFITFYLEPQILQSFGYNYKELSLDLKERIGIDEAGKGDYFGPLCIAGVCAGGEMIKELVSMGVRDSKKMSDSTVLALKKKICHLAPHSIVRLSPTKYNELYLQFNNLNQLLAWGHATAIAELVEKTKCRSVIIDQFASEHVVIGALKRKGQDVDLTQRHRGEEDVVVAAASILARGAFLEGLEALGNQISMRLPKGASEHVVAAAKELVAHKGREILSSVAKLHFKTTHIVLEKTT